MKKLENKIIKNKYTYSFDKNKVFQGICYAKGHFFITTYDRKKNNSMVYILNDKFKFEDQIELYNDSHVGGICYDPEHNLFWITDKNGTISGYEYDDMFKEEGPCIPKYKKINISEKDFINYKDQESVAYITYFNKKIYAGNFRIDGKAILKTFTLDENGKIEKKSCKKYKFIDKVQGLTLKEMNGKILMFISCSYGKTNKSELKICKFDENIYDLSKLNYMVCEMPSMMEQICFNENEELCTLYEINSYRMKNILFKYPDIIVLDTEKLLENTEIN